MPEEFPPRAEKSSGKTALPQPIPRQLDASAKPGKLLLPAGGRSAQNKAVHLLPLVVRELSVACRRPATFRARIAAGALGMGATVWAFLVWSASHGQGAWFYRISLYSAALLAMVGSLIVASDSISRERRDATLGFLFLTDLRAADIVLGKLAASALVLGSTVVALFPGLALCQLLGGISSGEFWRGVLALSLTLVFSLACTVFVSAHCEDHRKALPRAAVLLLFLNPLWLGALSFENNYRLAPFVFWSGVLAALALACAFLRSAATATSVAWRDSENCTSRDEQTPFQPGVVQDEPVAWMLFRRRRNLRMAWLWLIFPGVAFLSLTLFVRGYLLEISGLALLFGAHLGIQTLLLVRTAYSFYTDRQDGSLELMLGTELSVREIFSGFNSFLLKQTRSLLLVLCSFDLLLSGFLALIHDTLAALPFAMGATLCVTTFGLGSTGVYRSLLTNHPAYAMFGTFARLSLVPTLLTFFFSFVPTTELAPLALFWIVASAFTAAFFGMDASAALQKHGRELLLRPFSEKPPEIENEWSFINWEEEQTPVLRIQPVGS